VSRILQIAQSKFFWLAMIVGALALEGIALYYQYALRQYPCMLCIHVRIWVAAFVPIGVLGLLLRNSRPGLVVAGAASVVAAIGMLERSWQTLATERGWTMGACEFTARLPDWFALDTWFPVIFQVQGPCGRTPTVLLGVSMAEALTALGVLAVAVTGLVTIAALAGRRSSGEIRG
jgi:disulfide bond formation protein DsbB